jgi:hypothetical protein
MIAKIPNLWPAQLGKQDLVTPRAILQRQAQVLAERSANQIQGEISTRALGPDFTHVFTLKTPAIESFSFFVVRLRHNIHNVYPVRIYLTESDDRGVECADEADFIARLRDHLAEQRVVQIVESLLAQLPSPAAV